MIIKIPKTALAAYSVLFCLVAGAQTNTTWSLTYSNSMDGWKGPVYATEISVDGGRILRVVPLLYQPFNTNAVAEPLTNLFVGQFTTITNFTEVNTNAVNKSVEIGTICAVREHMWVSGCGMSGCLVMHGDTPMRHCILCKRTERRELGPWK